MKAIWTGTISFGLVQIPIKIVSAIQTHQFGFRILHEKCHTPLEYERWCPKCKKEVGWEDTVKGFEQSDGSFRVFTKQGLEKFKPEKSDRIEILACVSHDAIDDIYQESHYYALPNKQGEKAYFLFLKALESSKLIAVGQFVMREKEYLCTIEPYSEGLLLNTLNYEYEVRELAGTYELQDAPRVSADEIALAKKLIAAMTQKKFDITKYKDTFIEQLKEYLNTKKRGRVKAGTAKIPKRRAIDLKSILRESLQAPVISRTVAHAAPKTKSRKQSVAAKAKRKKVA